MDSVSEMQRRALMVEFIIQEAVQPAPRPSRKEWLMTTIAPASGPVVDQTSLMRVLLGGQW